MQKLCHIKGIYGHERCSFWKLRGSVRKQLWIDSPMLKTIPSLLLRPSGRIGQKDFWIGLVVFMILILSFNFGLRLQGNSVWAFLISLPFPFIAIHMTYSLYGKRLHDMGHSVWPLTGMIVSLICVAIIVMLAFGGSEYFNEFSQYGRKDEINPAVRNAIIERYQARMAQSHNVVSGVMMAIITGFTLWCGLSKSQKLNNKYGPALTL